jgi:hypothetical protein
MSTQSSDLSSGIKTREQYDEEPYGHKVEWVEWDSDFRNSELQLGDIITGVDDKHYLKEAREKEFPKAIGNYLESTYWQEQGGKDGQTIRLHVLRDGKPLTIAGKIRQHLFYYDANQKPAMGPGGPARLSNDGFSSPWMSWYEKFVRNASIYLGDPLWERSRINNVKILEEQLEEKPRIEHLQKSYPGPFADKAFDDWKAMIKSLEGRTYTDITEKTLEYRQIGEQRTQMIKEMALKTKKAFVDELKDRMIPPFPAVDPIMGKVSDVTGKVIELPYIPMRQFINDLGRSYAVSGSQRDGYYVIHVNDPEMDLFFGTLFRYQGQVTPQVSERYQFFGEIRNEPIMVTFDGRPITGLMVKVIAGMAGQDNFFVDLRKVNEKNEVPFAGEEALSLFSTYPIGEDAPPEKVIEAMIHYIKYADKVSWKNLFSTWRIFPRWSGPPVIDTAYILSENSYLTLWEQSRKQIVTAIYDVRVLHTGPVFTLVQADKDHGIPHVEQVKVIIDHIGKFGDAYRSISNINVHRKWILQRINGGAWKIVEPQAL